MAGEKKTQICLNNTLLFLLDILNNNNVKNWFISYGTLLGIVRENSCIENDDDIDICCDINDYDKIKNLLINNGLEIDKRKHLIRFILKTKSTNSYCSIDFYMCHIDNEGNFNDKWEKVIWSKCYIDKEQNFIKYFWKDKILYLPNNYETKIKNRYGANWKKPQKSKGPKPIKKII